MTVVPVGCKPLCLLMDLPLLWNPSIIQSGLYGKKCAPAPKGGGEQPRDNPVGKVILSLILCPSLRLGQGDAGSDAAPGDKPGEDGE